MPWTVEVTHQFELWWDALTDDERISIDGMIRVLERRGPSGPPFSEPVSGSRHADLRQLHVPHAPHGMCVLYVTDESRSTLILLMGSNEGCERNSRELVGLTDAIYDTHVNGRSTSN